jgi:intein/homing endonuclease
MKRLLRSVIDVDGKITQENLVHNFQKLFGAHIDWSRPEDGKIFEYALSYFQQRYEMPASTTIRDYFAQVGGTGDLEVLERLKDVESATSYIRTNFTHLLSSIQEEQNKVKTVALLKEAQEIVTKGLDFKEGREKVRKQGVRDGVIHFTQKAFDLIQTDYSSRTRGDIRQDGQAMVDEYDTAKVNKDKVWGRFTGLNEIDKICHGIKPGELWVHAGFPGELKCLAGDVTVYDHATNRRRTLREMFEVGDIPTITALDREGETFRLVRAPASHLVQNGVREVFDLFLSSGRSIGATGNHKFFTPTGWKELSSLKEGDWVATPKQMSFDGQRLFTDAEVKVVGYLIGDGACTNGNLNLTASNEAIRRDFMACLIAMGLVEGRADYQTPTFQEVFPSDRAPNVRVSNSVGAGNSPMESPVRGLLDLLGLYGKGAYDKHIPEDFFSLPEDQVALLLGALWSTDGSCHHGDHERDDRESECRRNDISYASVSRVLCLGVQSLLLRLGIQSSVIEVNTTYKGEPYKFHVVRVVTRKSKSIFTHRILVVGKEPDFAEVRSRLLGDDTPIPSDFVPEGAKAPFINGKFRYASQVRGRPTMQRDTAVLFRQHPEVARVLDGDLTWEQVTSVASRGHEMTYDLSVPEHHTFVANDIVTHNTTFALNWCYNLVTRYRTNVVYFSLEMPYEQIRRQIYVLHSAHAKWATMGYQPLDYRNVRDGELTPEDEEFYKKVVADFASNPEFCEFEIICPDRDLTIKDIKLEAEMLHKQTEVGLVVIDHGQLVVPVKSSKDYVVELNSIVRDAKKLALHFNHGEKIPVLMLFQINRQGKEEADKNEGRYKASSIAYANEVEKSADIITTTYLNDDHRRNGTTVFCNLKDRDNPKFEPFLAKVDFKSRRIRNMDIYRGAVGNGMGVDDHTAALAAMGEV